MQNCPSLQAWLYKMYQGENFPSRLRTDLTAKAWTGLIPHLVRSIAQLVDKGREKSNMNVPGFDSRFASHHRILKRPGIASAVLWGFFLLTVTLGIYFDLLND